MGVSAAVFESAGKRTEHYIPGVYSRSYNVSNAGGVSSGNLVIMGKSQGGKPLELLEFGSLGEAKQTLISGELLEAVAYAFNGSKSYVPQKVFAMRVNEGTQSSLTLSAGTTELLSLKSWDYGVHTNMLKMWVQDGDTDNSKKIVTVYKDNTVETDDIIRESISIQYIGEGTGTVTVGQSSMILTETIDSTATNTTLSFDDYSTLGTLVSRINDTGIFSATVLYSDEDAESAELDTVTSIDVTDSTIFYSNFQAFVEALEDNDYLDTDNIEILTSATRTFPDTASSYVYFTGGTVGSYSVTEWGDALEQLETEDVQIIATPSTQSAIQTLILNHCTSMSSTTNRKERTCWFGGALNESDTTAIARAVALNSELASYVADSVIANNPITGESETVSGAYVACMLAGMEAAMAVHEPLTNKTLNVTGFSKVRTNTNMEKLIKKGICVVNPSPADMTNYICIRAMTTYQKSDLIYNERSMTREAMYMDRDLRAKYAPGIGEPNNTSIANIQQTLLDAAKEWQKNGYIVQSDDGNNVWDIKISVDGDKIKITYSRYLTAPTNFIFITAVNHVYTSTTEA